MQPPDQVTRNFGKALRELRLKQGMTQERLAEACGLDISYIGGIERGQRNPTLGVIHGLAKILRIKPSELLKKAQL